MKVADLADWEPADFHKLNLLLGGLALLSGALGAVLAPPGSVYARPAAAQAALGAALAALAVRGIRAQDARGLAASGAVVLVVLLAVSALAGYFVVYGQLPGKVGFAVTFGLLTSAWNYVLNVFRRFAGVGGRAGVVAGTVLAGCFEVAIAARFVAALFDLFHNA